MKKELRIKEIARERGMTLSEVAGKLGIPRSNMSAIASGSRGISLKVLYRISNILDCGLGDLFLPKEDQPVFKDKKTQALLKAVEDQNYDGIDKTWVDYIMLAQKTHYGSINRGA